MISSPPPPDQISPDPGDAPQAWGPRVMVLVSGGRSAAILAECAREVVARPPVIRLPSAAEFVCGVINVRGSLVPLVDLGQLLQAGRALPNGWVVTLDLGARRCALAVDSLPVLCAADAPPVNARDVGHAALRQQVRVAGTCMPLLDVAALADDLLLHQSHAM